MTLPEPLVSLSVTVLPAGAAVDDTISVTAHMTPNARAFRRMVDTRGYGAESPIPTAANKRFDLPPSTDLNLPMSLPSRENAQRRIGLTACPRERMQPFHLSTQPAKSSTRAPADDSVVLPPNSDSGAGVAGAHARLPVVYACVGNRGGRRSPQ